MDSSEKKTQWEAGTYQGPDVWGDHLRERVYSPARKCTFLYSDYISDKRGFMP